MRHVITKTPISLILSQRRQRISPVPKCSVLMRPWLPLRRAIDEVQRLSWAAADDDPQSHISRWDQNVSLAYQIHPSLRLTPMLLLCLLVLLHMTERCVAVNWFARIHFISALIPPAHGQLNKATRKRTRTLKKRTLQLAIVVNLSSNHYTSKQNTFVPYQPHTRMRDCLKLGNFSYTLPLLFEENSD